MKAIVYKKYGSNVTTYALCSLFDRTVSSFYLKYDK